MTKFKSLLMFSTVLSFAVTAGFSGNLQAKTIWLEENDFKTVAEGDGEYQPTNFTLTEEEVSLQAAAMKPAAKEVRKETVDDEKLPTLTSEGSFLLPTYILPEAQADAPKTVASVDAQNPWRKNTPAPKEAKVTQTVSNSDKALLESIEKQYQDTTALLASTAKRLEALENGIENLSKAKTAEADERVVKNESKENEKIEVNKVAVRAPLLLPLAPIRTVASSEKPAEEKITERPATAVKKEYVDYVLEVINRNATRTSNFTQADEMILRSIPKEMKISFLPDSADLSTQAFKWIKAFSYNPQRTVGSAVEVRLSPNNLDLQSRRFALIKGALLSNGLAPRQIRFVFTDRDADTVILRNIELPEEQEIFYQTGKNGKISQQIIQKW